MNKPLVSVIIPTFNRAGVVLQAVASVLSQNYEPLELVVVDDGSTDDTTSKLAPLAISGQLKLLAQPNRGVSAARNAGILATTGPLIAFLDSDDQWLMGKIQAQVDFFHKNPNAVLVQTQEQWVRNGRRVNPGVKHLKKAGDIFMDSLKLCLISPSAVMLKRSLLEEVGLFDEKLLAAEDYDLWLRILNRYPVGLIDKEMVVRHGGHPGQLSAGHSLDRYRVMALEKILAEPLDPPKKEAAEAELHRRRHIYLTGRAKRQNRVA